MQARSDKLLSLNIKRLGSDSWLFRLRNNESGIIWDKY